jgi:hypothetical protein
MAGKSTSGKKGNVTAPEEPKVTEMNVVYIGRRMNGDDICQAFITQTKLCIDLPEDASVVDVDREASLFAFKRGVVTPKIIGGVYSMKAYVDPDGRIRRLLGSPTKLIEPVPHPHRAAWDALDQTSAAHKRANAIVKKLESQSWFKEDVKRLADYYDKLPFGDRVAFEVLVLKHIRKW